MAERGLALGIDLGGTKIYAVVTDRQHNILSDAKINTPAGASPDEIAAAIVELGKTALAPLEATFEILDVYEGTKYDDTCITTLELKCDRYGIHAGI